MSSETNRIKAEIDGREYLTARMNAQEAVRYMSDLEEKLGIHK